MRAALLVAAITLAAAPAAAQGLSPLDLLGGGADDGALAQRSIQILLLITVLSIVPGLAVTITCFPFVVTVLSILRQALGMQQSPPNMLIVSLALFLSWFVMEPVMTAAWDNGVEPYVAQEITLEDAVPRMIAPFRGFMAARTAPDTLQVLADLRPGFDAGTDARDAPLSLLVPSFLLSELSRAFQVGFLVFLPFLVIDLVVAAVLMSMGMMMVPPAIVSLPFKLAFFVVADGWSLIAASLVRGYG
ncbi:MAG: flagellar type III secretion system pore protein FliP [Rubellimicrobium sp.]|nr:flagellar type III secretion system pore protein FliP [Rubellimicrobium sp.]